MPIKHVLWAQNLFYVLAIRDSAAIQGPHWALKRMDGALASDLDITMKILRRARMTYRDQESLLQVEGEEVLCDLFGSSAIFGKRGFSVVREAISPNQRSTTLG